MDKKMLARLKDKDKSEMSDNEVNAKVSAVTAMRDMAAKMMGDKLGDLKKVTVAAPDKAGLAEGLDKAKELVSNGHTDDEDGTDASHIDGVDDQDIHGGDSDEDNEEDEQGGDIHPLDAHPDDDMSEEELNEKLEKLMALKSKMASKKV